MKFAPQGPIDNNPAMKCVPKDPIDNKPALVKMMAWRRIGSKPLSEPVLTRFTDAYMRHHGEMS